MLALTLAQAKTIAVLVVAGLIVLALASAWLMKAFVQKVALVAILGVLAVLVWSQRAALQDCADDVRDARADVADPGADTTCSFFGRDIEIRRTSDS